MSKRKSFEHVTTYKNEDGTTTVWKWNGTNPVDNKTTVCYTVPTERLKQKRY